MSNGALVIQPLTHVAVTPVTHVAVAPAVSSTVAHASAVHAAHTAGVVLAHGLVVTAAVAGIAVGAVLVTKVAVMGTEALATGLVNLSEEMKRKEDEQIEAEQAERLWLDAAGLVVSRNAEIDTLRAAIRRLSGSDDPDLPLPPQLDLRGQSLCSVHEWCLTTDELLERVRSVLREKRTAAALRKLGARADGGRPRLVSAAEAAAAEELAVRYTAPRRKDAAPAVSRPGTWPRKKRAEELVARLAPDASAADLARVLEQAASAVTDASQHRARGRLDQLEFTVDQVNRRTRARHREALDAARYLRALRVEHSAPKGGRTAEKDAHALDVERRLDEVVAGERDLDQTLRAEAEELRSAAEAAALRAYRNERLVEELSALGYAVEEGPAATRHGQDVLVLSGPRWNGEHVARLVVGEGGGYALVRLREGEGVDASRREEERCTALHEDVAAVTERLRADGVPLRLDQQDRSVLRKVERTEEQERSEAAPKAREREQ